MSSGVPLTGITKELFPLPTLESFFRAVRNELINGKGFILFKGIPVEEWGLEKCAVSYMGLGSYFGYFVSQNGRGHVLGHVKVESKRHNPSRDLRPLLTFASFGN